MNTTSTATTDHQHETIRILHVDDEPDFADLAATFLTREDDRFEVETATNVAEGLELLEQSVFDCIVSDHDMPGQNGIEFLEAVRENYPDLPFVLFTGKGSEEVASDAISAGVSDYLQKGSGTDRYGLLANRITNLVSQYRTEGQLETRAEQQRRVADLGKEALAGASLETLFDHAAEIVADTLDNEYAKVLEYRPDQEDVLLRAGVGWGDGLVGEATVGTGDDSQAGHTLRSKEPIVVEDLRTEERFRGPSLLVDYGVVSGISVIIGSYDDPWGVLGTHTTDRTVFTDDDITFVQNVANILANAIKRTNQERQLRRQERRYQAIFNDPNILVGLLDTDGTVLDINQTAMGYVDASLDEITDTPFWETPWFNHSETVQDEVKDWIARAASGEYVEFEADLVRPNGDPYTIEGVFRPVTNDDGEVVSLLISDRDITEQKDRERELEDEREFVSQILESLHDVFYFVSPDGELQRWNTRVREVTGYSESETEEMSALEFFPEDERPRIIESIERTLETGSDRIEAQILTCDGTRIPYEFAGQRLTDSEGKVLGFVGIGRDISDRKEREHEYERVLDLLNHTQQIADVGGWEIDPRTKGVFWSDHLFEMLGWDGDEEPPLEEALDVYVEEDRPRVEKAVEDALAAGESFAVEARFRRPDGEVRWFDIRGEPTIEDGEVTTVRGAVHDITDRRRRERILREMYDITSNRHQSFEDQVQALIELGRKELKTEYGTLSEIRGDEYVFQFVGADDESIQSGDVVPLSATNCELVASSKQTLVLGNIERDAPEETDRAGFTEWGVSCYIGAPVFVGDEVYGTFCFYDTEPRPGQFSDWEETLVDLMSSWASHELQRHQANEQLRKKNEQLEQFASVVSHDLRNPLNVVEGRLELAREECDSEHLDQIDTAIDRMNRIIEDVLWLAREGREIGSMERVELQNIVESAWHFVADRANKAQLRYTPDENQLPSFRADSDRLSQLLENLLRNAVEHSGSDVTVTVGVLDDGFYVEDDGPGIPEEDRNKVFEAGYSTSEGGTGFGLSIVKQVADAHGWDIRVIEGSQGGARFEITGVEFDAE